MAVQQTTDISKFRDQIIAWRASGLGWREIADELAAIGVEVQWNAVWHYARETGIPTGRIKKQSEPRSEGETKPAQPPDGAAPAQERTPEQRVSDEAQTIAEIVTWITPAILRIEQAKISDDPAALQRALEDAVSWLQSYGSRAPADFHQRIFDAIEGLKRFMVIDEPPPPVGETATDPPASESGSGWRLSETPTPRLFTPLEPSIWHADEPVLEFGNDDRWTLQDSFEGTLVVGATGSGKTSGSGKAIAESFLSLGYGGLVLTAKDDERALWEHYAARAGRSDQLCIVQPGGPFKFNFLDYQTRLAEEHGGSTENVVELFHSVLEAFSRSKRTVDSFWSNAAKQLLRNIVRIMRAAKEPFSLKTIRNFLSEMPRDIKAAQEGGWRKTPTFGRLIAAASRIAGSNPGVDLEEAFRYWTSDFPGLWHETRSTITADFAGLVDLFFEPAIYSLFGQETTLTPEAIFDGAIVVVDLSIKKHHATGRLAQLFWKHLFQLAVERRHDAVRDERRPVFLWADEAQYFVAETDLMFQATARSSRCATVYLTQTLPGFQAATGGDQSRERTDGLFANLTTKIIHANGDPATNKWAAEQVGRVMQYRASVTTNSSQAPTGFGFRELFAHLTRQPQSSVSTRQEVDFEIQPVEFSKLRTGSARYGKLVDAIFMKSGACFSNGKHFFKATFQQE